MKRSTYTFSVLRYSHDPSVGEMLNIGVLVYSAEAAYVDVLFEDTYVRLSTAFAAFDGKGYHRAIAEFRRGVENVRDLISARSLGHDTPKTASEVAWRLWPDRDLSFRVGESFGGLTANLPEVLKQLFEHYVTSQFTRRDHKRRDEKAVWETIQQRFDERALRRLVPTTVQVKSVEITFDHTFVNARLHVIEPLSFDYVDAASIIDTAIRWRGKLEVASANPTAKGALFHMIVGSPKPEHRGEARKAEQVLKDASVETQIIEEENAGSTLSDLSREILLHDVN